MIKKILKELKCVKCGSENVKYCHDFEPMENHSEVKVICDDCGHIRYLN